MKLPLVEKAQPLREQVYNAILSQLKNGYYAPGERVTEGRIAKDLAVSRTPVREAMGQLHRRGVLVARAGGGYVVPSPTLEEISEIFFVRALVEPAAVKMAAEECSEEQIADIDSAIGQEVKSLNIKNPSKFSEGNQDFRAALFDHISNAALKGVISQFTHHLQFLRMVTLGRISVRKRIVEQQKIIRDAIAAHDGPRAEKLWHEYLNSAKKDMLSAMKEYQERDET